MGEKIGFLGVVLLFAIAFIPFMFFTFNSQVESSKFLSATNEMQQMVLAEGGVTEKVSDTVDKLAESDFLVQFTDNEGNHINGLVDAGERINISYDFKGYKAKNHVVILKR